MPEQPAPSTRMSHHSGRGDGLFVSSTRRVSNRFAAWRRPHTLRQQLVLRVTAIVVITAILVVLASTLLTRDLLTKQVDRSLDTLAFRQDDQRGPGPRERRRPSVGELGTPEGTLVYRSGDVPRVLTRNTRGQAAPVAITDENVVDELEALGDVKQPQTVRLQTLGRYRVVTVDRGDSRFVVGLPLGPVDEVVERLLWWEVVFIITAGVGSAVVSRAVIVNRLRPLTRLADAADEVSGMDLQQGEVRLPVRLGENDANPRTEVGRVGVAFTNMVTNVEQALTARHHSEMKVRQFVADASHELRNPLASIRGYSEVTRRQRADLPPDTAFALSRIDSESERMTRLVDDLLLLARLDNDPQLNLEPVDVAELAINAVSDAQVVAPDHHWHLRLGPATDTADQEQSSSEILGDRYRLQQVFANVLSNARKHTPPGTTITTSIDVDGSEVVVRVEDDGPGIPPDLIDSVFERFVRGEASRSRSQEGSTGLGLAIVLAIVEAHDGIAKVSSRPGHTLFEWRLPHDPSNGGINTP